MNARFLSCALLAALALFGCGPLARGGAPKPAMHAVDGLSLGVANEPSPPRTGENTLVIVVQDAAGKPVRGARVETVVFMPAMGAMPYMESRGKVSEAKPGVYRAAYGLSMAGDWDVTVRVTAAGGAPVEGAWRLSTHLKEIAFSGGESGTAPEAAGSGTITLDPERRQAIGVRTARAEVRDLVVPVKTRGTVAWDETHRADVSLKISGWVREVRADFTGRAVAKGEALFTVYSPEVWSAEQEYVTALRFARSDSAAHAMAFGARTDVAPSTLTLAEAARQRLLLWDVPAEEIAAIARGGAPRQTFTVRSPASGVIVEKLIVAGSPVTAGQVLYRIARTDPVWIEAQVYEADLPLVAPGMAAEVTSPYTGGSRRGKVTFIGPALTGDARTAIARIELANPGARLKPGMYVDVALEARLGRRLAVPQDAIVPTGERNFVFVDKGGGRLEPRAVTLGPRAGDWTVIASGIAEGETVVTSGNFLVAADARLKSAIENWQARP